ncbi:bifunctional DNA-formamidopyrimidine glycosylase/DNA-(apurinic or apyrimidinic site) lyase [Motilimonas sp. E26]|uniref:bifunctional DNA-formamidopyrimidine glycosylase/DNA-(apurinic or apyrimidinic site) lyase n=1 Tax=Motilimonas sp. E26 TaxID=2865674 RepID=UPI001E54B701|nr:bifunctional DNA-formamidopyrimidine glycosylase/DNA-(apurinic or apyrimidinic site) lyase [Motilimonas sp. E26]MCE0558849.1 bifunctional DNA-formamidopyrimidine glycosylase/DNA-(apurinic or apyrimidinic site) lyase [Motilimonas sp. E26]
MPELPEVEVSRQGIAPFLTGATIKQVIVREPRMRWPVPDSIQEACDQVIERVERRAKYILLRTQVGSIILHLGMSGNLRVLPVGSEVQKHDHIDIVLNSGQLLRLHDPRRFGACLWVKGEPELHPLLAKLGPEPLTADFSDETLFERSRGRKTAVKQFIMDNANVVGVGNIYANESLFRSGIHPKRAAGNISKARYQILTEHIKTVLAEAITQGGTTLKDFTKADGKPGYFVQQLAVYGRAGLPCTHCGNTLQEIRLGQRSTVFCTQCQR